MPCQPRMLEPSKPSPSSNTPSSSLPTGIVKCCDVPSRCVKRRSTALTSFSRHRARTSRGVIEGSGFGVQSLAKKKSGRRKPPPALINQCLSWRQLTTHHSLIHLLDEQHLLIRR